MMNFNRLDCQRVRLTTRNKLQPLINSFPITLFLGTVCFDWLTYVLELSDSSYEYVYYIGSELFGSSLFVDMALLVVVLRHKLCLYNVVAVSGLIYMNTVNIFSMHFVNYTFYESYYNHSIIILLLITSIWLLIRKK